jgi:hypothetical protein
VPTEELHEVEAQTRCKAVECFLVGDASLYKGGVEIEEGRRE